jgi:hypothetical protein
MLFNLTASVCKSSTSTMSTIYMIYSQMSDTILKFLKEINLNNYEFWLSLCKIARSSVILLLPLFIIVI